MRGSPEDIAVRLQCLKLACELPSDPLTTARQFYAFATAQDERTPRQIIDAALEAANVT